MMLWLARKVRNLSRWLYRFTGHTLDYKERCMNPNHTCGPL